MLVTVAICSLNHAESLRRTLESLAVMEVPDLDWEVLVVNNGCTDHTDQVIAAFADRLPMRCEVEPERGLSRARNRAVDSATDAGPSTACGLTKGYGRPATTRTCRDLSGS